MFVKENSMNNLVMTIHTNESTADNHHTSPSLLLVSLDMHCTATAFSFPPLKCTDKIIKGRHLKADGLTMKRN